MACTIALLAVGACAAPLALADDAPPSAPERLGARAYSGTAGGIAWQRSTDDRGAVRGYEVTRDGRVLGIRDALSYVDRTLQPGSTYRYGVAAIDSAGQRSTISSVSLTTPGAAGPVAGGPAAPAGFRAEVYSSTALGLAWARPATVGLRYEVRRDGQALGITDGTSYIESALSGGRAYRYEVIAIDRQGRRSAASAVTVRTPSGADVASGPAAPAGLRASVYSSTALGLAWVRPATVGLRYEVRRDGQVLGITDGTSYIESALSGGRAYRYEVVAIDRQGRRSAAATVAARTPGAGPIVPPAARVIDLDSYEAILRDVIAVLEERPFADLYDPLPLSAVEGTTTVETTSVSRAELPLSAVPIDLGPYFGAEPQRSTLSCDAGGDIEFYFDDRAQTLVGLATIAEIDACALEAVTLDGISYRTTNGASDGTRVSGSVALSATEADRMREFTGEQTFTIGRGFRNEAYDNRVSSFESSGTEGRRSLERYRSERTVRGPAIGALGGNFGSTSVGVVAPDGQPTTLDIGTLTATLESSFVLRSPSTGGRAISVEASLTGQDFGTELPSPEAGGVPLESYALRGAGGPFSATTPPFNGVDEPFYFGDGEIRISAEDGSAMTLRPLDAETVEVSIGEATIPLRRADGYDIACTPVAVAECSVSLYR